MQRFGGTWTDKKLEKVKKYLEAYSMVMKNQNYFKKIYIDAFAGTGYREGRHAECKDQVLLEIDNIETEESRNLKIGSARIALEIEPPFDEYIFIEKNSSKCRELQNIKFDYPNIKDKIRIIEEDANIALTEICKNWGDFDRGVLFLDPFGMQVKWETIQAVAHTEKIDMWYLFPSGIGVNRNLPNHLTNGNKITKIFNSLFGSNDWFERFYKQDSKGLFEESSDESIEYIKSGTIENIRRYLIEKLGEVFKGVAPNPLRLYNSKNVEMFLLCFACNGSEKARKVALRIANYLLQ